jgi:hypothetical protein
MSIIDRVLIAHQQYAKTYHRKQGARPRPTLVWW